MSLLSWNCRGLGGDLTVRTLKRIILKHKPSLVFLSETHCRLQKCTRVAKICKYKELFAVDAKQNAGGFCVFWQDDIEVSIISSNKNHIHMSIYHAALPTKWLLTCVHGPPYEHEKPIFWSQLENLVNNINEPCIMIGDLNEIMSSDEKFRGRKFGSTSRNYLENFVSNTGAIDIGSIGNIFT